VTAALDSSEIDHLLIADLRRLASVLDNAGYLQRLYEALENVVTVESGEPLVPLNRDTLISRLSVQLVSLDIPADERGRAFLRRGVVDRLNDAARSLPAGYSLIIRDALRTRRNVLDLYQKYSERLKAEKPALSARDIDLEIRNLLAMPDNSVPPGHMTGGAVDVVLGDADGNRVDVELPADRMPRKLQAPTFCPGLPSELIERRTILLQAMTRHGFHNYFREYWHFSYGDAYWAVRRKVKVAIYGIADASRPAAELD
jgi:zinc D-Ala-D-Ala dipeptidase